MNPGRNNRGFVLPVVLFALVIMSLLVAGVALSLERLVEEQRIANASLQGEIDGMATAETALFLMATEPMTLAGFTVDRHVPAEAAANARPLDDDGGGLAPAGNEVRIDGRAYQGIGGSRFAIRDDHGRLPINWTSDFLATRFLTSLGASPEQLPALRAKLLDFQDSDELRRLGGAEAPEYAAQDLGDPPNLRLGTALGLRDVMDWGPLLEGVDDRRLLEWVQTGQSVNLNLNTAPADVLALLPGSNPEVAERIMAARRTAVFTDVNQALGLLPDPDLSEQQRSGLGLYPAQSGTLAVWTPGAGPARVFGFTLTPYEKDASPWRIDYDLRISSPADDTIAGPAPTSLFADAAAADLGRHPDD